MIRVLVVEDEPLIAEAHREYVGRVDGFEVVGVAHTGSDAVRAVASAARVGTPVIWCCSTSGSPTRAASKWLHA